MLLPLLRVKDGKHVLAGHEALLHIFDLQIVQRQHVLLLFLLRDPEKAMGEQLKPLKLCGPV